MRYFIDFEFIEDGHTIDPLSVGIVAEDGREFYAQNIECDRSKASEWVREHVIPHLQPLVQLRGNGGVVWMSRRQMAASIRVFCDPEQYGKPEFWGYYADYDWVALCQLFGTMMDLPKGFPMYCRDLKQWCDDLGNPKLPEQGKGEHHALLDARWNRDVATFLLDVSITQTSMR